jgi:hypothetical protein
MEIKMNIKKTTLATAVTAVLAMGAAGQAVAYEYAISSLYITSLNVILSDNGGTSPGGGTPTSFEFTQSNTAFLNSAGDASTATCSGTFGGTNNCTGNLDAEVVNGTSSDIVQGENTFTVNGPGTGSSYSNGDSVIYSASLLGGATTSTQQQAEAEINPGDDSAAASTEVGSTTGFNMTFVVDGENQMEINMTALLNIFAEINDPTASGATVKANTEVEFKLSKDGTNLFFTFRPDGDGTNECFASALGLTCTALADEFDLNTDINITGVPNSTGWPVQYCGQRLLPGDLCGTDRWHLEFGSQREDFGQHVPYCCCARTWHPGTDGYWPPWRGYVGPSQEDCLGFLIVHRRGFGCARLLTKPPQVGGFVF